MGFFFTGFNGTWVHAIFDVLIWHECYLMPQEAALFVVVKHVLGHTLAVVPFYLLLNSFLKKMKDLEPV